jgi:probable phosphoglycerate mutase
MNSDLELWLVRHGETVSNASKKISGWSDVNLSAAGIAQAEAIKSRLQGHTFDDVWSSDLKRAIDTAKLAWGTTPKTDPRIREINFGTLENRHWEKIDPQYIKSLIEFKNFNPPGGENLHEFATRLKNFITGLKQGKHLIFTHGGVVRMLTKEIGFDQFIRNAGIIQINWTKQKIISLFELDWALPTGGKTN